MKKLLLSFAAFIYAAGITAQQPAVVLNDQKGWHKIAETTIDFERETDEVKVLLADRFAALRFKVKDAPIEIVNIEVFFTEGDSQKINIGTTYKKEDSESKPVELKGAAERRIDKIALTYKTASKNNDKKATVEIWGKKTNAEKGNSAAAKDNKGQQVKSEKAADGKNNAGGKSEVKKEANEAKKDVKKETKEIKKETKEVKKEAKSDAKDAKKEGKEMSKEAKEDLQDLKE